MRLGVGVEGESEATMSTLAIKQRCHNQAKTINCGTLTPPTTTTLLIGRLFVEANAADGEKERRRSDSSMLT